MISPSQRPLPDNTQHSQQTNLHAPGGIRTHDRSRRAAVDLRLRPCGYWDRPFNCNHSIKSCVRLYNYICSIDYGIQRGCVTWKPYWNLTCGLFSLTVGWGFDIFTMAPQTDNIHALPERLVFKPRCYWIAVWKSVLFTTETFTASPFQKSINLGYLGENIAVFF